MPDHSFRAVGWGDHDGDGVPDLAVGSDDGVRVFRQSSPGQFQVDPAVDTSADYGVHGLDWADCDGDGAHEPAVSYGTHGTVIDPGCYDFATSAGTGPVAWSDFDGDGRLELGLGGELGAWVIESPGPIIVSDEEASALAWGQFSGSAVSSLVLAGTDSAELEVYEGRTAGPREIWNEDIGSSSKGATAGDIDRDGYDDVVYATSAGPRIFLGRADGRLQASVWESTFATSAYSAALGDIDGDGWLDLAVGSEEVEDDEAGISVWFGDGAGGLETEPGWQAEPTGRPAGLRGATSTATACSTSRSPPVTTTETNRPESSRATGRARFGSCRCGKRPSRPRGTPTPARWTPWTSTATVCSI